MRSGSASVAEQELGERQARQLNGLLLTLLGPKKGEFSSLDQATRHRWSNAAMRDELPDLLPLLDRRPPPHRTL
jgi:hypothetical protein